MFERFTDEARQSVVFAQEEARTLKHNYIGTEHLLVGLLRVDDGLAARALFSLDLTLDRVRRQIVADVPAGDQATTGNMPFMPSAKRVLELALREALSLKHNYIGTEHILLGLLRDQESTAARVLHGLDVAPEAAREAVLNLALDPNVVNARKREMLVAKASVIDAQLKAAKRFGEVATIISRAEDPQAAVQELRNALGFSEEQARFVIHAALLRFTSSEAQAATTARAELQRSIEAIDTTQDE